MRLDDIKKGDIVCHPNGRIFKLVTSVENMPSGLGRIVTTLQLRYLWVETYAFSYDEWNLIYNKWTRKPCD